jgi:hypothetical protein
MASHEKLFRIDALFYALGALRRIASRSAKKAGVGW